MRTLSKLGGSDLHLCVGRPPMARVHGSIKPLEGTWPTLTQELIMQLLYATMPVANRRELAERRDTDYAYELKGVARFRCNAYVDRSGNAAVMRRIPEEIVPFEQLGLPKSVTEFCNLSKGLVLVTGPTGSGKSTTLATLIDRINASRREHIITMEDPIEFVHQNKKCLVNQRE
ncbi:MAG: Flp pilus assembly complex ATPase component TadA, partial [Phycisphaerae bacterium]|nr:Flp pilus assembly complex ATPase component TadA [Phycisphaerae bacterium]